MGSDGSLNHVYRTVWSQALGAMVAVAWGVTPTQLLANPTGGVAIQGQATLTGNGSNLLVTTQNGAGLNHSAINWQSFSIPTGSSTYFQQPNASSTSINRVVTNTPSLIFGTLGSNGNLVLVNQSGITVGAGAVVDTAGFTASALRMGDADALAGRLRFGDSAAALGAVSVYGSVLARSGDVVLLGARVDTGSNALVQAPNGSTVLAAGQQIEITGRGLEGIVMQVQAPADSAVNLGTLQGDAVGIFAGTLKHSGLIQATTATLEGGRVVLRAAQRIEDTGEIKASGTQGGVVDLSVGPSSDTALPGAVVQSGAIDARGTAGPGGAVHIQTDALLSSAAIDVSGASAGGGISVQASRQAISTASAHYTADSAAGKGGSILVSAGASNYTSGTYTATGTSGGDITLAGSEIKLAGSQIDASGSHGGGRVRIGGLEHGAAGFSALGAGLLNATNVYSSSEVSVKADALQDGDGGQIVLWADQNMRANGNLSATGGAVSGNGGSAEVSGVASLGFNARVNLSAAQGQSGTLLLDPHNITVVAGSAGWSGLGNASYAEILDPTPGLGEGFGGSGSVVLANGNFVIPSPSDSTFGNQSGAVYLFSATGTLLSTLAGSAVNDQVGLSGISQTLNNKFLVASPMWGSGLNGSMATTLGAITWMDGNTGQIGSPTGPVVGGLVSATNSLVGTSPGDRVGVGGVTWLGSGNALVRSPYWGWNGVTDTSAKGAVTWIKGATGLLSDASTGGTVSAVNSLVGSTAGDKVGVFTIANGTYDTSGVSPLSANLLVFSNNWSNGGATGAGAVTWMNSSNGHLFDGSTGGAVSQANSLIGTTSGDSVGSLRPDLYAGPGLVPLDFDKYLIRSPQWGGGGATAKGAVTWFDAMVGIAGDVGAANSMVGSVAGDRVGAGDSSLGQLDPGLVVLNSVGNAPRNYVVVSSLWNNLRGAVTWGNGLTGTSGVVSGASGPTAGIVPSLVGEAAGTSNPLIGSHGITQTAVGNNFVVSSPWDDLNATDSGAVTWINGNTGELANSTVGARVYGGVVSAANSLLGISAGDLSGLSVLPLQNGAAAGNLLIKNSRFNNGGNAPNAGAITWMNGATGALSNGSTGGPIAASNSLLGSTANDYLGTANYSTQPYAYGSTQELPGGNVLMLTPGWTNADIPTAPVAYAGAATWMDGSNGHLANQATGGVVSAANSLVGTTANDNVGNSAAVNSSTGNILIQSPNWTNTAVQTGPQATAGAITWMDATTGKLSDGSSSGAISSTNSLVGDVATSLVGNYGPLDLGNGRVALKTPQWGGNNRGAVTWMDTATGQLSDATLGGVVGPGNSLVGVNASDNVGGAGAGITWAGFGGNYVVHSALNVDGALTWVNGSTGKTSNASGLVSSANSILGAAGDAVGNSVATQLDNGNLVFSNPNWGGGKGAVTWMNSGTGQMASAASGGLVSSANSLVGATADVAGAGGDHLGSAGITTQTARNFDTRSLTDAYVVVSPEWNGTAGAVTLGNAVTGTVGVVGASNSLVGAKAGDAVGSGGVSVTGSNSFLVSSPQWSDAGATVGGWGAVTYVNSAASPAKTGLVSAGNSLVGSAAGDLVGSSNFGSYYTLQGNGNLLILSDGWGAGKGALTWMNGSTGALATGAAGGTLSASNSLLGSVLNDLRYSAVTELVGNGNWVLSSPNWANGAGAVTWMNGSNGRLATGGFGAVLGASSSLVGTVAADHVGGRDAFCDCSYAGQVLALSNGNYLINSPSWNANTGAATWASGATGLVGAVSSANSALVQANNYVTEIGITGTALVASGLANAGRGGVFLMGAGGGGAASFGNNPGSNATIGAEWIASTLGLDTNVLMQANNDITVEAAILVVGQTPGTLSLQAGRSIAVNANITTGGADLTLVANETAANGVVDANRDAGAASLTLAANTTLNAGAGKVSFKLLDGAGNTNKTVGTLSQGLGSGILANSLDVQSFGGMALTGNNLVGRFSAQNTGAAAIHFNNTGALVLGSLSRAGLSNTQGTIKISAAGDLSLTPQYGSLNSGASGTAVVLATGGNFSDGGNQITTANGRWLVYSTDPRLDTLNPQLGLSLGALDFKQYAASSGTAVAQPAGNGFLYSLAPSVTASLNGSYSKTYDRTTAIALTSADFTTTPGSGFSGLTDVLSVAPMTGNFNSPHVGLATGVTATGMAFASAVDSVSGARVYGYQFANSTTAPAPGSITKAGLSLTAPTLSKTYDGTVNYVTSAAQLTALSTGLVAGDSLASVTLAYADKNAGTANKAAGISALAINDGNGGNNYNVTLTGNTNSTIDKAVVTLTAPSIAKTYDGGTAYTTSAADLAAMGGVLASGDSVATASLAYADKNAGTGNKAVSLNAFTLNDGNGGANYTVTLAGNTNSTITPLTQVTWSNTLTSGNWSDPASWTGNLVPDGNNVLAVSVLNGAAVTYDLTTPTTVQAINMTGSFTMTTGSLAVTGNLNTPQYIQTGGALTGTGGLTVTNSFSQTAGSITMAGPVSITQGNGNLSVGSISGSGISLAAASGSVSQIAPLVTAGLLKATASNGVTLTQAANAVSAFSATTTASGNIALTNAVALDVQGITAANGNVFLDNTGAIANSGTITANAGTVSILAHSPITIGNTVDASGNITLAALTPNGSSNITLNGAMTSTAGGISIQAYNNFIQNSNLSAALAIDVSTIAGNMTFGPGAYSVGNPVMYTVNGAPYMPPWIASTLSGGATDFVVAFLDQFQAVLDAQQVAAIDDPLGLKQRGQEGIVVEGEVCKP